MTLIRRATQFDTSTLAQLNGIVHELHVAERPDQFIRTNALDLAAWYRSLLAMPAARVWIAEQDGVAAGYVLTLQHARNATQFSAAREWCDIDQIAVHPAHRRKGIATALINTAVADAVQRGITAIELSSWAFNHDMHALLKRLKFVPKVIRFEIQPAPGSAASL